MDSASRLPSTKFHGRNPLACRSEPTTSTGVVLPSGIRHCAKLIRIGKTSATPSTDSAR